MSGSADVLAYTVPGHIHWSADGGVILLVDRQAERSWLLDGEAAVLWARLPGATSLSGLVDHWTAVYSEDRQAARDAVRRFVDRWLAEGLLVPLGEQG